MKITISDSRLVKTTIAAALLVAMVQPGLGEGLKYKPITVKTPDGLTISAQEWGNPAGPEILFIHGFSRSHLSWMRQVEGDLAKEFRIVTSLPGFQGLGRRGAGRDRYRRAQAPGPGRLVLCRPGDL